MLFLILTSMKTPLKLLTCGATSYYLTAFGTNGLVGSGAAFACGTGAAGGGGGMADCNNIWVCLKNFLNKSAFSSSRLADK